jgi:multiple sugar transport system permease protein
MSTIASAPTTAGKEAIERRQRDIAAQRTASAVITRVFLIVMSVLFIIPLYWMVVTALKSNPEMAITPPTLVPQAWLWHNFVAAFNTIPFATYFSNSLVYTVGAIIGAVLSNMIVAYGFACIEWRGRDLVFYLVLATIFIPFPLAIIPQFDLFAHLHWVNTMLPLIVPHFLASAFYIFLLRQFFLQLPRDLFDAARIDGASEWSILWRVVVPMSKPVIAVVAIFTGTAAWNDFLGPLIYLQNQALQTLSIGLVAFRSTHDIQYNLLMAASFMIIIPLIVLFFVFQRFFIEGISLGSLR